MAEMVIEVPENWKAFFQDVAERMKETPEKYWGGYLVRHLNTAIHDDDYWIFCNLQRDLMKKHSITLADSEGE